MFEHPDRHDPVEGFVEQAVIQQAKVDCAGKALIPGARPGQRQLIFR